jgi:hypothetical protein
MAFYGLSLAIRAKSILYFLHANPKLKYSGAFDMLKEDILKVTPKENLPITDFVPEKKLSKLEILGIAKDAGIEYPFILKPNIGERGKNVAKISNENELDTYLETAEEDLLIQEYAGYETHPIEAGVFVNKDPETNKIKISNLTFRQFPIVIGDGVSTLEQLVEKDPRCVYRYSYYKGKFGDTYNKVIPKGEEFLLEYIGSHNRGTGFKSQDHLIDDQITESFQKVVDHLDNYYYGRFDVKAKSKEDLFAGNFKILEINGINAEPISIYDSGCSFCKAYRVLMKHMKTIYNISVYNKKNNNTHPKVGFVQFMKDVIAHQTQVKQTAKI